MFTIDTLQALNDGIPFWNPQHTISTGMLTFLGVMVLLTLTAIYINGKDK